MIKLKQFCDEAYQSQKYVRSTDNVKKSLVELAQHEDYKTAGISEIITLENYTLVAEWVSLNKDDLYDYQLHSGFVAWYFFVDRNGITHEIRLTKGAKEKWEIKLWFLDKDDKPNYTAPNVYGDLKYDTAIFNTHIYILINELIPYFFSKLPDEKVYLPATDKARHRLYRITLNNHLDKTKYKLEGGDKSNELVVSQVLKQKI
jgi:hypothetical protein